MDVKVLGPGCPRCRKLYEAAEKAIAEVGVDATITKIEKLEDILAFDVMSTPALVVDGVVKASGRVPTAAEIAAWLRGGGTAR